jgi:predicted nucleotide-binding protein
VTSGDATSERDATMESLINQMERLIEEGNGFDFDNFSERPNSKDSWGGKDTPEWFAWKRRTLNAVTKALLDDSPAVMLARVAMNVKTNGFDKASFERAKSKFIKSLKLALDALKQDTFNEVRKTTSESTSAAISNRIFVVHGHDHALRTEVESFLHEIGLEPVVLHRKPDEGRTIIEKFEHHSDVGYAFILLTADEVAYTVDQEKLSDDQRKKEMRARPNVIFEFGYFVGRLGRDRVCCIHKGDVVLPSDLDGLVYKKIKTSLDSQAFSIIRELKAAGYAIKI